MAGKKAPKRKRPKEISFTRPTRHFVCIVCPNCCKLETDGTQVAGALCRKGEDFACQEWIAPLRVLTTTLRVETQQGIRMLPVKTSQPVPLARVPEIMKEVRALRLGGLPSIGTRIHMENLSPPLELIVTGE